MRFLICVVRTILLAGILMYTLSINLTGQSNWTHGVGLGIAITDFAIEPITDIDESRYEFNPVAHRSFHIWNKSDLTDDIQLTISPGFSWRGARFVREGFNYDGIYLVTPITIEYNLIGRLSVGTGIEYSHLISFGESSDDEIYNLTSQVDTRHTLSYLANMRYEIGQHISVNVAYNRGINAFYQLSRFNTAGGTRDRVNLRNRGLQITFIFHT